MAMSQELQKHSRKFEIKSMRYFVTYFDHHYLTRGLALYQSMRENIPAFKLAVICLSDECFEILKNLALPHLDLLTLSQLEDCFPDLKTAKENRSRVEYYFTCTPSLIAFAFEKYDEADWMTYLDGDLYFFSSPEPIFEELKDKSVGIIAHRFHKGLDYLADRGKYNVGWLSFKRDESGQACLSWYQQKCIEWCYDKVEEDRYADQKYLDFFQDKFKGVAEISHKGANLAPWNIMNYRLSNDAGSILVDDQPLIFYHFHGFKHLLGNCYDSSFQFYQARISTFIKDEIYFRYFKSLKLAIKQTQGGGKMSLSAGIRNNKPTEGSFCMKLLESTGKNLRSIKNYLRAVKKSSALYFPRS